MVLTDNVIVCSELDSNTNILLIIYTFNLHSYLTEPILLKYKRLITKFRLSSHCLAIETGRHKKVPLVQRFCKLCNSGDIEVEYHFMFKCQLYQTEKEHVLKPCCWRKTFGVQTDKFVFNT